MTDGVLLAQLQRDKLLSAYDAIIIDEAHERSLNIDFLLGYLSNLLPRRPDLKVVITSATIDSELFAAHFGPGEGRPAPVINVTGRTYPVDVVYRPQAEGVGEDQPGRIVGAARELMRAGPGDILVFCSGEREIRDAADALAAQFATGERDSQVELLPLYSRLSAAEQHRVFEPHGRRRIVLATNVAETSLTVPSIHYVIDSGTARISRYSKATKVQRLPIEPISQASANQRAGRCGRVARGVCVRLYSEEDFDSRPEFTEPEILRTSLAAVILQMMALGVVTNPADVARFGFVQPPDPRGVADGVRQLEELGAIRSAGGRTRLTRIGRMLARLPVDPRLGRMLIEAERLGVAREVSVVAAALSIQDPRERPIEFQAQADAAHARFADPTSDFLAYLNLWEYLRAARRERSSSAYRRLIRSEYLSYLRLREWEDLVKELRRALKDAARVGGGPPSPPGGHGSGGGSKSAPRARLESGHGAGPESAHGAGPESAPRARLESAHGAGPAPGPDGEATRWRLTWPADSIHRALLSGLLSQVGLRVSTEVGAGRGWRASRREQADSRRRSGRNEYLGARGIKFAIHPASALRRKPPGWVMAAELVETSRLWARTCAAIDPLWVEAAAGDLARRTHAEPRWSAKRGAAVVTERVMVLGLSVVSDRVVLLSKVDPAAARELFIRHALVEGEWTTHHAFYQDNRELLDRAEELAARSRGARAPVNDEDLFDFYDRRLPGSVTSVRHFDAWWKKAKAVTPDLLSLDADFLQEAGPAADGFPDEWRQGDLALPVTYQYQPGGAEDGVTVHIPIRLAALVRRDGFDWQVPGLREELVAALIKGLPKRLRAELLPARETARLAVALMGAPEDWADAAGRTPPITKALASVFQELRGVYVADEDWDWASVPAHLRVTFQVVSPSGRPMTSGTDLRRTLAAASPDPAAVVGSIASAPAPAPSRSEEAPPAPRSAAVLIREAVLDRIELPSGRLTSRLAPEVALPLAASRYPSVAALTRDAQAALVDAHLARTGMPDGQAGFEEALASLRETLEDGAKGVLETASSLVSRAREIDLEAGAVVELRVLNSVTDVKNHVATLLADGFLSRAGPGRLDDLGRYLEADAYRLPRLGVRRALEDQALWQLAELGRALGQARAEGGDPAALEGVEWMLEEFRVSLFAQHLGTAFPVSEKRIRRALAEAARDAAR
jgi:ATP-dependent helicase HrpA